ncbi:MAG: Gfo/Idh/MocA family oxidoreductase [Chloroflexi bacterium]|nr:Gfo/Idh/MocA family oxidoreductase [Chloroflexota bacterium]
MPTDPSTDTVSLLRAAIIGTGQIARRGHLPGYVRAGVRLEALCSRRGEELNTLADDFGVERRYGDWHEMLEDGGFDVVSICTPPALHCEMAVECLQRGLAVLVEKPMALTPAECDRMIAAAEESGALLVIAHNQRYVTTHQAAKQILQSGRLGKPYLAHAVFGHGGPEKWSPLQDWYFHPAQAGHGVLADLGSHKFDLLCWLLDQQIVEIGAFGQTFEKPTAASDTVVCTLRFSGGTLATVQVSWVFRPDWENSLVLRCERGSLHIPTDVREPLILVDADTSTTQTIEIPQTPPTLPVGWRPSARSVRLSPANVHLRFQGQKEGPWSPRSWRPMKP